VTVPVVAVDCISTSEPTKRANGSLVTAGEPTSTNCHWPMVQSVSLLRFSCCGGTSGWAISRLSSSCAQAIWASSSSAHGVATVSRSMPSR
jgi:hypothetical protein